MFGAISVPVRTTYEYENGEQCGKAHQSGVLQSEADYTP